MSRKVQLAIFYLVTAAIVSAGPAAHPTSQSSTAATSSNLTTRITADYFAANHDSLALPPHYTTGYDDNFGGGGKYSEQANIIIGYNERIAGLCRSYLTVDQLEKRQGDGHNSKSNSVVGLAVGLLKASV